MKPYMKHQFLIVVFILLTCSLLCVLNIREGHIWGGDSSLYINQAKSIIENTSEQLAINNKYIVDNSSVHTFSPTLYPWGYSILLTPIYAVFNLDFVAFKILVSIFLIGALLMMFLTFKNNNLLSIKNNLFFIAIIGLNIEYIKAINIVYSEIPFVFFSFLSLYLILKLLRNPYKNPWLHSVIIGFVLFFCFNIRTEGAGLFIALFIGQLQYLFSIRKEQSIFIIKHLPFIMPYITAIILYFLLKILLPLGFTSHFGYNHLVSWNTSIFNLEMYFKWIKENMFGNFVIPYLTHLILLIGLIGISSRIKKDMVLTTYFFFLIALFTIWPFRELRYLYVIYPFMLYFLIQGLHYLYKLSKENTFTKYFALFILWVCVSTNVIKTSSETFKSLANSSHVIYGPETKDSKAMFAYIKEYSQEQDIIGFFKPRVMHFYSNRISLALFNSYAEIIEKADYYVETKAVGTYFQIPIESKNNFRYKNHFKTVFSNKDFNIYKIIKP